jgi:hypothetical protein
LYGAFVWARRALNSQKRRFPARAGEAGDNLKMLPLPTASCTLTEEGDQYNVHFTRRQGAVVSLRIEGGGMNEELLRHRRRQ